MLSLVVWELVPEAFGRTTWPKATAGAVAGSIAMLVLGATLGA